MSKEGAFLKDLANKLEGLGANTTDAQSDRGGHSIGFTNGGTPTTSSAPVNYLYGASQGSASVDLDTTSYHTLYGDLA